MLGAPDQRSAGSLAHEIRLLLTEGSYTGLKPHGGDGAFVEE